MSQDDVERVARAIAALRLRGSGVSFDDPQVAEYFRQGIYDEARAALSAMPQRELLAEALEALESSRSAIDFYDRVQAATSDEQIAVGQDHWNWLIDAARRSRAAADKIRDAMGGG